MGMVIVVGSAMFPAHPHPSWQRYDILPNPVGLKSLVAASVDVQPVLIVGAPVRVEGEPRVARCAAVAEMKS